MVNDKNAWQYSGLVSLRTTLLSQCCTALCSGKTCLEANVDKCIKSNKNTYAIALQSLSGRLFCFVVGHFLLFPRWPEATFFPSPETKKHFQTQTVSHHQKRSSQMKYAPARVCACTHTYALKQKYIAHTLLSEIPKSENRWYESVFLIF